MNGRFAEARFLFGDQCFGRRLPDRTIRRLTSIRARRSLGDGYVAAGAFDAAVAVRTETARLSANAPGDVLALADALGQAGRYAEAWELYVGLRERGHPDPHVDLNGGQTALALGRTDDGVAWLRRRTTPCANGAKDSKGATQAWQRPGASTKSSS